MLKAGEVGPYKEAPFNPDGSNQDLFLTEINNLQYTDVCDQQDVNIALKMFLDKLMGGVNKHAALQKRPVRRTSAPGLDNELKSFMLQRQGQKYCSEIRELCTSENLL